MVMHRFATDARAWTELNKLLDVALDQPASQRDHWLETLAPEFAALKPHLRDLLSRADGLETDDFLNTLPKLDTDAREWAPPDARADQPGDEVGPYRLVRELGNGGMGTVWLAQRTDGLINRPVALKLPHGAWRRAGLAERMTREREILATLNHPNIARLYDAGIAADGQPYLALEYVEGRPIDAYCRDQRLEPSSCLALFVQVANAVANAHGKLIIHRDLKPANILVTADGQVRLLDFGIAKLLGEGQAKATKLTEFSGRALTPDYASPEQILGEFLTIASDIYSLGVILYELLSGRRPYKLKRDSRGALEDAIVQTEPALPSAVADRQRGNSLRGDLDTIVLKALKKNPQDRYPTVHALLDDIERYLSARPVLARPDSARYRVAKFVRRNKLVVATTLAIFLALVGGSTLVAWQARVALTQRNRAEEVKEFIASVFREADPTRGAGDVLTAAELLSQAERRLKVAGGDAGIRLELLTIISESLFGLQQNAEAARVASEALSLQSSTGVRNVLLKTRLHLVLSQAYEYLDRNDEAHAELQHSFAELAQEGATNDPLFIQLKLHEAALGLAMADYATAERAANEAISIGSSIAGPRSSEVATAMQLLSQAYMFTKRGPLAVQRSKEAFDLMLELYSRDMTHPKVMDSAMYYSQALAFAGDFEQAAEVIHAATENAERVFGKDNRMVGELYSRAVVPDLERGALQSAVENARASIRIYLRESQPGTPRHAYLVRLLGHSLLAARAGTQAVTALEEAVRVSATVDSASGVLHARASLGMALVLAGRLADGEKELHRTLDESGPATRPHHQAMRYLGTAARLQGRNAEAVQWLEQAIAEAGIERVHRNDLAAGLLEMGLAKLALGETAAAQDSLLRAEKLFSEFQSQHITPARAELLIGMARLQMNQRNFGDALALLEKADSFWHDFDIENRGAGAAALWLGRCYLALGRSTEARAALNRAETILERSTIPADITLAKLARART
jgi:tetratricopeptide (TPR) repeat protein/tRNA A-37 threonylcarbamoyl transferase component Bud32